ncbi:MAG: MFS transporter [Verrucomicrobiaceae bacterium]|nr:MFS transporter [Verrucomicrobiaceae bacterium]
MYRLHRKWWICGLLLLATTINYMDRQTLANAATRVTKEFSLTQEQYGDMEMWFGWAFAAGSLVFGFVADRVNVRWLYPVVLLGWSMAGVVSAWTRTYEQLLWCRIALGLFEAAHWPCALKTTFALLSPQERTMGNSVLQSGASIGAIITPQVMLWLMTDELGTWRLAFQVVGFTGVLWVALWFIAIRASDFQSVSDANESKPSTPLMAVLLGRRFWAVAILLLGIQTCWHLFRVWLPKFLQEGRGYSEKEALWFNSAYFISTDVGCILAGALSLWLARSLGMSAHDSKRRVYLLCALLTCLAVLVMWLPAGWMLLTVILLVGAGSLGLFPCYYSFVQELSDEHVGRLTGLLSMLAWAVTSPMHKIFGAVIDKTKSFDLGMALAGLAPLLGVASLALLWPKGETARADNNARNA